MDTEVTGAAEAADESTIVNGESIPWLEFGGMFRNDPVFDEVIQIIEENRRQDARRTP